jgi:phage terminase small subunit
MAKPRGGGLTDKQKLFAREYLKDLNATQAAIRAGYSVRSAGETGSKLRDDPEVLKLIEELQKERADRLDITTDRIEQELARVAFFDIKDVFSVEGGLLDVHAMPANARRAVASVEVDELWGDAGDGKRGQIGHTKKVRTADKLRALELLGKRHGMFVDKVEMKVEDLSDEQLATKATALIATGLSRKAAS